MFHDTLFLLNPLAKDGTAKKLWLSMQKKYDVLPNNPVDITQIEDLKGYINSHNPKVIAIAGGDGTINMVCNVVSKLAQKPILTIFPLGFGNALSYCLGVETVEKAISVLRNRDKKITIDLMKTN